MTIRIIASQVAAGLIVLFAGSQALAGPLEDGQAALHKGDYAAAIALLTPLAAHGDKDAQYELGRLYEGGNGVTKDYAKAAGWYRKSALGGDHRAQLLLALMYAAGQGVPQDDKQGLDWLSKATADDPPQKQMAAKSLYFQMRGSFDHGRALTGPELMARALPGLQKMADQGDAHAKCALLQLYETGQAVPRKTDDVASMHGACAAMGYGSADRTGALPAIPALPVPPLQPH